MNKLTVDKKNGILNKQKPINSIDRKRGKMLDLVCGVVRKTTEKHNREGGTKRKKC